MKNNQLYLFGAQNDKKTFARKYLTLPLDTLIMAAVMIMLLLTIAFSLGVEKGRKITSINNVRPREDRGMIIESRLDQMDNTIPAAIPITAQTPMIAKKPAQTEAMTGLPQQPRAEQYTQTIPAAVTDSNKYVIQVASFAKENIAQEEAKRLENKGYSAVVAKKGKFTVVFVGNFADKNKAQENMQTLRKQFKDCFVRTIKNI